MDSKRVISCRDMELRIKELCRSGHTNKLKKLIKKNPTGLYNSLYWACCSGFLDTYNSETTIWNYGLAGACLGGHIDIVNLMIEKGANDWNWGLSGACRGGHLNIVKLMISKGAHTLDYRLYLIHGNTSWNVVHFLIQSGTRHYMINKSYIGYLFNLPKLDRSVCYLLEDLLHQDLIFCVIRYL
jgi:hypothetical protein